MPIIQPDLSQSAPLQPGPYRARITEVEYQTSKKGNPMVVVTFDVQDPSRGITVSKRSYLVVSGAGTFGFAQLLRATGFGDLADAYQDTSRTDKPPFDTDDLQGLELTLQFDADKDQNGNPSDKIVAYLPA